MSQWKIIKKRKKRKTYQNVKYYKYCKIIGIDLSRTTNLGITQQINFAGKLEEDHGATMFFIAKKKQTFL